MAIADSLCIDNTVNETSCSTLNGANVSSLKPLSANEIAHDLDVRFNLTTDSGNTKKSAENPTKPKPTASTPAQEKGWTPLSQSTPIGIPDSAQPKDLLKAKSKLSELVHSVGAEDDSEEEQEQTQESEYDRTPSKSQPKERKPSPHQAKQFEDLKNFRDFVTKIPQGQLIIDLFNNNGDITSLKVQSTKDAIESFAQTERLKKENDDLIKSNEELIQQNSELQDQQKRMAEIEQENIDLKSKIDEVEETVRANESSNNELNQRIESLLSEISSIRGNPDEAISPNRNPDLSLPRSDGRSTYEHLELSQVDSLAQVQAQNIIKNILINLQISYPDIKEGVTRIGNFLKEEDTLCDFANKIHRLLYEQDINLTRYKKELPNSSTLKQCTLQMYQNVELLYAVLKDDNSTQ